MGFDYRSFTGLGKQTLGGHKPNLVCMGSQEKEGVATRDWVRLACECLGASSPYHFLYEDVWVFLSESENVIYLLFGIYSILVFIIGIYSLLFYTVPKLP